MEPDGEASEDASNREPALDDGAERRDALRALAALIGEEVFY